MPDLSLPEIRLPDIKLPEGLRDMNRHDIQNALGDRLPKKIEMPDVDLSKVDLPKALDDRLTKLEKAIKDIDLEKAISKIDLPKAVEDRIPGRKRSNPILPLAALLAVGSMFAAAWYLITSPTASDKVRETAERIKARVTGPIMDGLADFLRLDTVSQKPDRVRAGAEWLAGAMRARGLEARIMETGGNPAVFGSFPGPRAERTLLIYCHYDVKPAPAAGWLQPSPFEPVLRAGPAEDGRPRPAPWPGARRGPAPPPALRTRGLRRQGSDLGAPHRARADAGPGHQHPGSGSSSSSTARRRWAARTSGPSPSATGSSSTPTSWWSRTAPRTPAAGPRSPSGRAASSRSS